MEFNATFIVAFISFIIFIIIMNQILYKPIYDIVEKRKNLIDGNYHSARENKKKVEAILQDRIDKLNDARSKVRQKTSEALNEANLEKIDKENEAKEDAKSRINENLNTMQTDKTEALNALKKNVIDLAQVISDKFLESSERIEIVDNEIIEKIMQD